MNEDWWRSAAAAEAEAEAKDEVGTLQHQSRTPQYVSWEMPSAE